MSPWTVDQDLGSTSWTWPSMPPCRQKLIDIKMFDPHRQYFKRGGHMPLMWFFGSHSQQRKTPESCARRARRAEERGWGATQRGKNWRSADTRGDGAEWRGWQHWWSASSSDDAWHASRGAWNSDATWWGAQRGPPPPPSVWSSDGGHSRGARSSDDDLRDAWSRVTGESMPQSTRIHHSL